MALRIPRVLAVSMVAMGTAQCGPAATGDAGADGGGDDLAMCRSLCASTYGPQDACGATCPSVAPAGSTCASCPIGRPSGGVTCCCCAVA